MPRQPLNRSNFQLAIICALALEYDAVYDSFDEIWADEDFGKADGDPNHYVTECMGDLAVVLVLLPGMGKVDDVSAVASLRASYNNLSMALVVGVCGAVPNLADETEVLLGDVIVSKYVFQYDFGRSYPDEFKPKGTIEDTLRRPNKETQALQARLKPISGQKDLEVKAQVALQKLQTKVRGPMHTGIYDYPGTAHDKLFDATYRHKHQDIAKCEICSTCRDDADQVCERALGSICIDLGCSDAKLVQRNRLEQLEQWKREGIMQPPRLAIHTGGVRTVYLFQKVNYGSGSELPETHCSWGVDC